MQAKEITRLNQVYNKLLKDAGCERVGKTLQTNIACNIADYDVVQSISDSVHKCKVSIQLIVVHAEGKAKLIDRHTVEVALSAGGTRRLTAKNILLAQGGSPFRADVPGKVC